MAKEYSIGYKFKGDASGFQRVAKDMSKSLSQIKGLLGVTGINQALELGKKAWDAYTKIMNTTEGSADKLEEQMGYLKGTVQGAMITLFSGDWGNLISNIKNTAEATRDLVRAQDEWSESQARAGLKIGDLAIKLEEAKIAAAEETDKKQKKKYLETAIDFQKQITAINVTEIQKRVIDQEDYYKKLFGGEEKYWNFVKDNIVNVVYHYDELARNQWGYKKQLEEVRKAWEKDPFNKALIEQIQTLTNNIKLFEDYTRLQDKLSKKGQWEVFLGDLAAIRQETANGEAALLRMTKQVTALGVALDKLNISRVPGVSKAETGNLGIPMVSEKRKSTLAGPPKTVFEWTDALEQQKDIAEELTGVFENMFSNVDKGFAGMMDAMMEYFKMLAVKLAALAATYLVLSMIPGFAEFLEAVGGFKKIVGGGLPGSTNRGNSWSSTKVSVAGKLAGQDIYISGSRWNNTLIGNT